MSKPNTSNPPGTPGRAPSPIPSTSANVPLVGGPGPTFPAPNAVENANAARGQRVIDAAKNIGRVDTSRPPNDAFPLMRSK